ncbi:hypothetical protein F7D13_17025 (plasmid) [Methylocystis rosea]|jgi:hypothetical protein|uniref:IstB-like ATP-binding domain-containing protein n=1 Tax=Methylocystis rosea TaxID=173366 RepID=A0ABX6ERU2_9HYPH|nr:hypothetical protein F7D13_17025 [Methylocystis rosea]
MRVEHHLLRVAEISAHERHAAVGEPHLRQLHRQRQTVKFDPFMAPIELIGLARIKPQRHKRLRRSPGRAQLASSSHIDARCQARRHSRGRGVLRIAGWSSDAPEWATLHAISHRRRKKPAGGRHPRLIKSLGRADLLILDDFGLEPLDAGARHDLLEILEERYGRRSTIVTSQLPVTSWHEVIGEPTFS